MKASELRIGNYLYNMGAVPQNQLIVVDIITPHNIEFVFPYNPRLERYYLSYKHLTPIPLNEEWLIKFGFEKRNNCYRLDSRAGSIVIDVSDILTAILGDGVYVHSGTSDHLEHGFYISHVEYVHQLQNLYFALTGEELTIKD